MERPLLRAGLIFFALALSSCQEATMAGGSGTKKDSAATTAKRNDKDPPNDVDQNASRTPEIDNFDETGWVPNDLRQEYDQFFKPGDDPETTGGNDGDSEPGTDSDGGTSSGGNPFDKDENVFWLGCDPDSADREFKIEGPEGLKVRLSGEFCPSRPVKDKLSVLFVVDFSGSMHGSVSEGPNDPTVAGSCGRLKAAQALVDSYISSDFKGVDVEVGMVGFSNDASLRIPFTPAKDLKSNLTSTAWCGSDSIVARTNYQAAFAQAESALSQVSGEKVVFFISDGSPTTGGGDPEASGFSAAQSLRNNTKELALNVIFVGYKNGQAKNPQGYLESVAGSKDKVTLVPDADKLVDAVQAIGAGKIQIKKDDVDATLKVNGKEQTLKLARFQKNTKRLNRWVFATESFVLKGKAGESTDHKVSVTATTSEGKSLKAGAVFQFKQQ